ncbi:MAG: tRNA (adenosine(37)-N6)-dimethylallyltransferase MiaA [Candidatus Zixiibacteriota bacterium]
MPVLTGPTGSGKSEILLKLFREYPDLEVISADSRQIYRGLDIGTDKPTPEQREKYRFHLIDIVSPGERYTAFDFTRDARQWLEKIQSEGRKALVCGGTGLYVRSLVEGIAEIPEGDYHYREQLQEEVATRGSQYLYEQLKAIDPNEAEKIHPHNIRRIIRALEIYKITGQPKSSFLSESRTDSNNEVNFMVICLMPDRERLYKAINDRVDKMMKAGLLREVEELYNRGMKDAILAINVIGYNELIDYLDDRISLDSAITQIKQNTRRFAKRQITWFKGMKNIRYARSDKEVIDILRVLWKREK